jgi:hypothetical protein
MAAAARARYRACVRRTFSPWTRTFGAAALWLSCVTGVAATGGCNGAEEEEARKKKAAELTENVQRGWGKLAGCLIGAPLEKGERASVRMLNSELTLAVSGAESRWPSSCDPTRDDLHEVLENSSKDAGADRYAELDSVLRKLKGSTPLMYVTGEKPLVDQLFAAAEAAKLGGPDPKAAKAEDAAPLASAPIAGDKLLELGVSKGFAIRSEATPGPGLRFLFGTGDEGAFHCQLIDGKAPLDTANCQPIERALSLESRPLSSRSAGQRYYFDPKPKPEVWSLTGEARGAPLGPTAFAIDDDVLIDALKTRRGYELVRIDAEGKRRNIKLKGPPGGKLLGFIAGVSLWRGPRSGYAATRPLELRDTQKGTKPGRIKLGRIPSDAEHLLSCHHGDTLAVALIGKDPKRRKEDDPERGAAVLFRVGNQWKAAVTAKIKLGAKPYPWFDESWRSFTCGDGSAAFTWLRADRRVGEVRCTAEGCGSALSEPLKPVDDKDKLRVTALGNDILVLRASRARVPIHSVAHSVSMRLAPLAEIAGAPEKAIVGDEKHGGLEGLRRSVDLVGGGSAAFVMVRAGDKHYGFRVGAKGVLAPVSK